MSAKEIESILETAYFRDNSEKIEQLSEDNRRKFDENLSAILEDDEWFSLRGLDDSNCSEKMVKMILYNEIFENDFSYLHRNESN